LIAPVAGPVERGFDPGRPFESGRHRGIDLAAAPGTPVRAACGGRVAFAGRIGSSGGIVTLRCGPWRVTHMPLATISARGSVRRGAVIGTVGASAEHDGLHLGVRRDGVRFGYEDPLRFLAAPSPPVPVGRARRPARPRPPRGVPPRRVVPPPRLVRPPRVAPRVVPPPRLVRPPRVVRVPPPRLAAPRLVRAPRPPLGGAPGRPSPPFAPWPAWAGLALVLAGAGLRVRLRRRVRTRSPARRRGSVAA
jgi:Peptidase family M23